MVRLTERKIILVTRRTRLDDLLYRYNTVEQARFYVESLGADFEDYLKEDRVYKQQLDRAEEMLAALGRVQRIERHFLPNFIFGENDLVVVIGQDGLVANTLKYVPGKPVIAVNPDPQWGDCTRLPTPLSRSDHLIRNTLTTELLLTSQYHVDVGAYL